MLQDFKSKNDSHMKWLALDIDGTLTADKYSCPKETVLFLQESQKKGWEVFVLTGRTASFAMRALNQFDFPFYLSAQNGSIVIEKPGDKVIAREYLSKDALQTVIPAVKDVGADFLVYAGFEKGDFCFYEKEHLSSDAVKYTFELQQREKEPWKDFSELNQEAFPLIKCFGTLDKMQVLQDKLSSFSKYHLFLVKDPFWEGIYLLQITSSKASKGTALKALIQKKGKGVIIAAGDDQNDLPLLEAADCKIAMEKAPDSLKEKADFIASSPEKEGIVPTLKKAMSKYEKS